MKNEEYIKTSDGRISVKKSEFIGHSVFVNPIGNYILIKTKDCPSGKCVNYYDKTVKEIEKAGQEINEQI